MTDLPLASLFTTLQTTHDATVTGDSLNTLTIALAEFLPTVASLDSESVAKLEQLIAAMLHVLATSTSPTHQQSACTILERLLDALPALPSATPANFTDSIVAGLSHPLESVRILCVRLLAGEPLASNLDVAAAVVSLLANDSMAVTNAVCSAMSRAFPSPVALPEALLQHITTLMDVSDEVRFRIYQLAAHVTLHSTVHTRLVQDARSTDVLVRVSVAEHCASLLDAPRAHSFLRDSGVLQAFLDSLSTPSDDPLLEAMCFPTTLQLVARAVAAHLMADSAVSILFQRIHAGISDPSDETITVACITALGLLGTGPHGVTLTAEHSSPDLVGALASLLTRTTRDSFRIAALAAFARLFEDHCEPLSAAHTALFTRATIGTPDLLLSLFACARNPFPNLHLPAYHALASLAQHPFARVAIAHTPGFLEFLLSRSSDHSSSVCQLKFATARRFASDSTVLSPDLRQRIAEYVSLGPFAAAPHPSSVAMEM